MSENSCLIGGCTQKVYAPAGTGMLCKAHFEDFVIWRRKKGGKGLFRKYSGMTMSERDGTVQEWKASLTVKK